MKHIRHVQQGSKFPQANSLVVYIKYYVGLGTSFQKPQVSLWEKTKLGWAIMSPGKEVDLTTVFCTQTSQIDYDNLCKLDVLGLADTSTGDQAEVYAEFKEQFTQDAEGWYEMGLPWRGNHPSLPNNGVRTFRWLGNLVRKLRSQGTIEHYAGISGHPEGATPGQPTGLAGDL